LILSERLTMPTTDVTRLACLAGDNTSQSEHVVAVCLITAAAGVDP